MLLKSKSKYMDSHMVTSHSIYCKYTTNTVFKHALHKIFACIFTLTQMPDLGHLSLSPSSSLILARCQSIKPPLATATDSPEETYSTKTSDCEQYREDTAFNGDDVSRICKRSRISSLKEANDSGGASTLDDYVTAWKKKKMEAGVSPSRCSLPFLESSKKMVQCLACYSVIYPGEMVTCLVHGCKGVYHSYCAKEKIGISNLTKFKCPQHACFLCKQRPNWCCVQCPIASHDKCAPWPDAVVHLKNRPGKAICWRHPMDWPPDMELPAEATCDVEEIFNRLPIPCEEEEFSIEPVEKDMAGNKIDRPVYTHTRRNVYLIKKQRDDSNDGLGCTTCTETCSENCLCRVQMVSCSKDCRCTESCNNRPFRKERKMKLVKTQHCGWGVEASEPIKKGDFIIEYTGEVIDDAQCEQRLWAMKDEGHSNFYMCEVRKGFTIDATKKGNSSRFLNHSCDPNCFLEKWQVEGETRIGIFSKKAIQVGDPLTYDYRYQQFGPENVECQCGAANCRGFLGVKRKATLLDVYWGTKRPRSQSV